MCALSRAPIKHICSLSPPPPAPPSSPVFVCSRWTWAHILPCVWVWWELTRHLSGGVCYRVHTCFWRPGQASLFLWAPVAEINGRYDLSVSTRLLSSVCRYQWAIWWICCSDILQPLCFLLVICPCLTQYRVFPECVSVNEGWLALGVFASSGIVCSLFGQFVSAAVVNIGEILRLLMNSFWQHWCCNAHNQNKWSDVEVDDCRQKIYYWRWQEKIALLCLINLKISIY